MKTFSAPLLKVTKETSDVMTFRFGAEIDFKPGQFVMLKVGERSVAYSISSSPTDRGYIEISMKMGPSDFKKALAAAKPGDVFEIKGPYGVFLFDESRDAIMLAGGIGITSLRSMIRYATTKKLPVRIDLIYSNKTPDDIAFMEELESMGKKNPKFNVMNTITRPEGRAWKGATGRIDANMIKKISGWEKRVFYVCGPDAMVEGMMQLLKEIDVEEGQIKCEKFTGY